VIGIGDLLLRWASELGGGKVVHLRDGIRNAARSHGLEVRDGAEGRWLRDVSALGHLDVDWRGGMWSIAPPVLTRLPVSDGMALIAGRRTVAEERAVSAAEEEWAVVHRVRNDVAEGDIPVPDSLLVHYSAGDDLPANAAVMGLSFSPCAAMEMFAILPDIAAGAEAAPPASSNRDTVERYDVLERAYAPADSWDEDGLYRWRSSDWARLVQIRRGTTFLTTEHEYGVYLELARLNRNAMRWRPEPVAGRELIGSLFVDWGAPLPPLHARAAVLCSGLQPLFNELAQTVRYDNVPKTAAEQLARSLKQNLAILPPKTSTGRTK
jgi:hypothetical protein